MKKTARDFIEKFDYKAALDILDQLSDFPNLKSLREEIRDVVNCLSKKKIAYIREKLYDFSRVFKNQSILSDILSFPLDDSQEKAKSLAEFVIEETIKKDHEGLIVFDGNLPKLNPSFPDKVAHGLSEIDTRLLSRKKLKQLSENLQLLLVDCLGIDSSYFNYYDKQNKELTKMLE